MSVEEQKLRSSLEEKVRTAFYSAGMALIEINELRLYRSTHLSFEEFCLDVFSFSSDYAYLKMAAARVYQNLLDNLPTIGRHFPLIQGLYLKANFVKSHSLFKNLNEKIEFHHAKFLRGGMSYYVLLF